MPELFLMPDAGFPCMRAPDAAQSAVRLIAGGECRCNRAVLSPSQAILARGAADMAPAVKPWGAAPAELRSNACGSERRTVFPRDHLEEVNIFSTFWRAKYVSKYLQLLPCRLWSMNN